MQVNLKKKKNRVCRTKNFWLKILEVNNFQLIFSPFFFEVLPHKQVWNANWGLLTWRWTCNMCNGGRKMAWKRVSWGQHIPTPSAVQYTSQENLLTSHLYSAPYYQYNSYIHHPHKTQLTCLCNLHLYNSAISIPLESGKPYTLAWLTEWWLDEFFPLQIFSKMWIFLVYVKLDFVCVYLLDDMVLRVGNWMLL